MIPPSLIVAGVTALVIGGQAVAIKHYHGEWQSEVRAHQADIDKATALAEQQKAHQAEIDAQRATLNKQKEEEHAKDDAARAARDAGELDRLRRSAKTMASSGVSAPGFAPKVCSDTAGNDRLRDALQRAKSDLGAALASYREGIGGLIAECGKNTSTLTGFQSWQAEQEKLR